MLSHRALVFMSICYLSDVEHIGPQDTKVHMAPMSHGSGLYALPFFIKGGHQVVLSGFDLEVLGSALERYSNVTLFAAPTMLTRLVNLPRTRDLNIRNLRTIYYGGGPMYVADLERALGIFGPRLFQIYGQGEVADDHHWPQPCACMLRQAMPRPSPTGSLHAAPLEAV